MPGMSEERKPAIWPWIVALLIGLPVLYVASFGPACWFCARTQCGNRFVGTAYQPIISAMIFNTLKLRHPILWYMRLGCGDRELNLPISGDG
jgi:hypothetical protein